MRRILSPTLAFLACAALGHAQGTDAVGGLHGHNSEDFIMRVQNAKQPRMDAIVSATSLAAESLGLEKQIGAIQPGIAADLVATEGNPLDDIANVRKVAFVMKAGKVHLKAKGPL
jgi:imidazolonepropionase-like amidohydrolase